MRFYLFSLCCGLIFFLSIDRIWPLISFCVTEDRENIRIKSSDFLESRGFKTAGYESETLFFCQKETLDYLEYTFGLPETLQLINRKIPVYGFITVFKKSGSHISYETEYHPVLGITGFSVKTDDDDFTGTVEAETARNEILSDDFIFSENGWEPSGEKSVRLEKRTDHEFTFTRNIDQIICEMQATMRGNKLCSVRKSVRITPEFKRLSRKIDSHRQALLTAGNLMLLILVALSMYIFLKRLQNGKIRLKLAFYWIMVIAILSTAAEFLQFSRRFLYWDPLWSYGVFSFKQIISNFQSEFQLLFLLLCFIAAGDSLDRENNIIRGKTLWAFGTFRFQDQSIAKSSIRGFFTGLICGFFLTAAVFALEHFFSARVALQPRGFYFNVLNADIPSLYSVLFFLKIALVEELGYRYMGCLFFYRVLKNRFAAVFIPALVYGLVHTGFEFLPPQEPFFGRALVMTVIGMVFGEVFLRTDILTVIISHLTADLFIFNWVYIRNGHFPSSALSAAAVLLPVLIPAVMHFIFSLRVQRKVVPET